MRGLTSIDGVNKIVERFYETQRWCSDTVYDVNDTDLVCVL